MSNLLLEEKREAIRHMCHTQFSRDCRGEDDTEPCPLFGLHHEECYSDDSLVADHYDKCVEAGFIVDKTCDTCMFEDKLCMEEPCANCRGNIPRSDPKHDSTPLLWKAKGSLDEDEPIEVITEEPTEPTEPKEDMINHPSHYTHGGMECFEEMELIFGKEALEHFCLLNAWKYRKRALYKNGQEDMDKSDFYLKKYRELKYGTEATDF